MTPCAPCRPRWIVVYLALVLVCQIEGHPHAFPELSPDTESSSARDAPSSISELIDAAYEKRELMRPQEWRVANGDDQVIEQTQWDASKQQESSSDDEAMQYRKRKLLQVSSTGSPMHRSAITMRRNTGMHRNSDEIIFPDGRITSTTSQTLLPSTCRRKTYCENVAEYPRQLVNAAIARNASLRFLESVDPMPDIEQRIGERMDESSLCPSHEQVVYPQSAQNKDKQWLFIVNQDNLKQGIRIEVCLNDGQRCNLIDGFAEGYKTTCKQKYIYRELAAVGSDGKIFKDQFRFPSSCCCHATFIGNSNVRFGLGLDLAANQSQQE
ncbi:protein spaetzle isoform X2 [Solenopsis invicta]|uniref:protein spaetzle isoform X2 n=1 Tax=Solenopsis invicta TaxID=13686 RepID=UPI000595D993|nr:protein spaetzle isoform X2 [Solenopsis invicta]